MNYFGKKSKSEEEGEESAVIPFPEEKTEENSDGHVVKFLNKIKPYYTIILILLISLLSFTLGRLSAIEEKKEPVKVLSPESQSANVLGAVTGEVKSEDQSTGSPAPSGQVIGSKTGKKYYFPWCGTVNRIKPENQVAFPSIESARLAGYTPGGNCKGLK